MKTLKEICTKTVEISGKVSFIASCATIIGAIGIIVIPDSKEKDEKED